MRNAEAIIQAALVAWIREAAPDVVVFAVPNDGLYSKSEAAKRKWTGVLAGIPDLALLAPGGRLFFVEVKRPGEKASTDQLDMMARLEGLGAPCRVCRSLEQAQRTCVEWGIVPESAERMAA